MGQVSFSVLPASPLGDNSGKTTPLVEAQNIGAIYCRLFNDDLPRTCPRCQSVTAIGLPCFNCGHNVTVRAQTLLPDEQGGYFAVSADAHDEVTAHIRCRRSRPTL